jgi:putative transposase
LIEIAQAELQRYVDGIVRDSVEETLNALLDVGTVELHGAKRYERSPWRADNRGGHYSRLLHAKAGEIELKVLKLRRAVFESEVIKSFRRCESLVKEIPVEMCLAGVSARRMEDIIKASWGHRADHYSEVTQPENLRPHSRVAELSDRERASLRLPRQGVDEPGYGGKRAVAALVAIGLNADGVRDFLGMM